MRPDCNLVDSLQLAPCRHLTAAAIQDCSVATPGVKGAVAGHGADLLTGRDLIQQVRQHRAVTFTA